MLQTSSITILKRGVSLSGKGVGGGGGVDTSNIGATIVSIWCKKKSGIFNRCILSRQDYLTGLGFINVNLPDKLMARKKMSNPLPW